MGIESRAKTSFFGGGGFFLLLQVFSHVILTFYRKIGVIFSILEFNATDRIQIHSFNGSFTTSHCKSPIINSLVLVRLQEK